MNTKTVAIHSGGDWADASADYVQLPVDGPSIGDLYKQYRSWYEDVFRPLNSEWMSGPRKVDYLTFNKWLITNGYAEPGDIQVFNID